MSEIERLPFAHEKLATSPQSTRSNHKNLSITVTHGGDLVVILSLVQNHQIVFLQELQVAPSLHHCEFFMGKWESLSDEQRRVVKNLEAHLLKQSEEDEDEDTVL